MVSCFGWIILHFVIEIYRDYIYLLKEKIIQIFCLSEIHSYVSFFKLKISLDFTIMSGNMYHAIFPYRKHRVTMLVFSIKFKEI